MVLEELEARHVSLKDQHDMVEQSILNNAGDDQVAARGLQFIMVSKALSPTHNPTLVPSSDIAKAALQLSTETRLRDLQFQMLCSILVWVCTNSSLQGMA